MNKETNNNQKQIPPGFKQTDIGLIPEDWEVLNISEVSKFSRGTSWRKSEESPDGVLVISIPNIKDGSIDFNSKFNHYIKKRITENKKLEVGDIIFVGSSGSLHNVGRNALINYLPFEPIAFASFTFKAKVNNKKIDNRFFYHLVNSHLVDLQKFTKRAADGKFNFQLQEFQRTAKIPLPPLSEQKKIAYVLSKIQQAIEIQEKIIKTTQELKKALMQKLFTEGLKGEPQKQTEIGLIPESWEVVEFENSIIENNFSRNNLINASEIKKVGSFPVIDQGKDFIAGYSDYSSKVYTPTNPVIIFGDHTRIFKYVDFPFIGGADGIKVFSPNTNLFNSRFYYYFLSLLDIPNRGYNRHYKLLKEKKIPKPSIDEQKVIATILSSLDFKIESQINKKTQIQDLFKTLLNQLMTGQIRVKDVEFELEETAEAVD